MCPGTGFEVFGLRYSASMPRCFIGVEVEILCCFVRVFLRLVAATATLALNAGP